MLTIYIPFPGFIGSNLSDFRLSKQEEETVSRAYGERWLELNKIEGEILSVGQTIVADVSHKDISNHCKDIFSQWSMEDLQKFSQFRDQRHRTTLWLANSVGREVTVLLEHTDDLEDDIIEYLRANGVIRHEE